MCIDGADYRARNTVHSSIRGFHFLQCLGDVCVDVSLAGYMKTRARVCSVFLAMRGQRPVEFGVGKHMYL